MTDLVEILFVIGAAILGAVGIFWMFILRSYILDNLLNKNEDYQQETDSLLG